MHGEVPPRLVDFSTSLAQGQTALGTVIGWWLQDTGAVWQRLASLV